MDVIRDGGDADAQDLGDLAVGEPVAVHHQHGGALRGLERADGPEDVGIDARNGDLRSRNVTVEGDPASVPSPMTSCCGLPYTEQEAGGIRCRSDAIEVFPCPGERLGADVGADLHSEVSDQRTAKS
jgi:hypothetical protein